MSFEAMDAHPTSDALPKKVLIVEDDEAMAVGLRDGMLLEGFEVFLASDGVQGLSYARRKEPDMIILDVMLPKMNGLDLCRQLRGENDHVPIIMLTARGQEIDKIRGLKLGADDYVTKPFSLMELIARMESIWRRTTSFANADADKPQQYDFGNISVDFRCHLAQKDGCELAMSAREFMLLQFFIEHRGQVVSRDQLLDAVWGYDQMPFTRTVDAHIAKLRKKIEDCPTDPRYLITVHRMGYKFTG